MKVALETSLFAIVKQPGKGQTAEETGENWDRLQADLRCQVAWLQALYIVPYRFCIRNVRRPYVAQRRLLFEQTTFALSTARFHSSALLLRLSDRINHAMMNALQWTSNKLFAVHSPWRIAEVSFIWQRHVCHNITEWS